MSDPLKKDFFKGTYQNVPDWVSSSNATENVVRDKSGNIVSSKAHAEVKGKKFTGRVETDQDKYLKSFINKKDQANYERMKAGGYSGGAPGSVEYARAKADQVSGRKTWDGIYTAEEADKANAGNGGSATDTKSVEQKTEETKEKTKTTPNDDDSINDFLKNQGGSDASSEMGPPAPDKDKLGDLDEKLNKEVKTKTTGRLASIPMNTQPNLDKADTVASFPGGDITKKGRNDLKLVDTSLVA